MKIGLLYVLSFFSLSLHANPHFTSELASGDAKITNLAPTKAFTYNPALLAWNEDTHYTPLFLEHRFSKDIPYILSKAFRFEKQENETKVDQIENILNKGLHAHTHLGAVYVRKNFGLALVASSEFDAIARGSVAPLLEMENTERATLFVSYAYALSENLSLGMSVKPTYKISHHSEKNAVQILDNGQILNPFKNGTRRKEYGVDLGASHRWNLSQDETLDSGVLCENLKQNERQILKIGSSYEKKFLFFLNRMQLLYAYVYEKSPYLPWISPHRLGIELETWHSITFAVGLYKEKPSFGVRVHYGHLELSYANYYERSPNIHRLSPDRMQAFGLHLVF